MLSATMSQENKTDMVDKVKSVLCCVSNLNCLASCKGEGRVCDEVSQSPSESGETLGTHDSSIETLNTQH